MESNLGRICGSCSGKATAFQWSAAAAAGPSMAVTDDGDAWSYVKRVVDSNVEPTHIGVKYARSGRDGPDGGPVVPRPPQLLWDDILWAVWRMLHSRTS